MSCYNKEYQNVWSTPKTKHNTQTPLSVKFTVCMLFFLVLLLLKTTQGKMTPVALSDAVLACLGSEVWHAVEAWGGRAGHTEDRALHSPALMITFWSEYVKTKICRGCVCGLKWPEVDKCLGMQNVNILAEIYYKLLFQFQWTSSHWRYHSHSLAKGSPRCWF